MQTTFKRGDRVVLNTDGHSKLQSGMSLVDWDGKEPVTVSGFETLSGATYAKLIFTDLNDAGDPEDSDFAVPVAWLDMAPPKAMRQLN